MESVQDTGSNRSKTVNSVFIDQLRLVELFAPLVSLFFGSIAWAGDLFCDGGRKLVCVVLGVYRTWEFAYGTRAKHSIQLATQSPSLSEFNDLLITTPQP